MSNNLDKTNIGKKYDKRIKMTDDDVAEAINLRKCDPVTWSYQKLANRYGVSKRLIIFRVKPETLEKVLHRRKERGGYKTPTDRQTEYMRKHRRYKRELIEEGKIKLWITDKK